MKVAFRVLTAQQWSGQSLPLEEIAKRSELTASATTNYLLRLVRTGLATANDEPGHYRLRACCLTARHVSRRPA